MAKYAEVCKLVLTTDDVRAFTEDEIYSYAKEILDFAPIWISLEDLKKKNLLEIIEGIKCKPEKVSLKQLECIKMAFNAINKARETGYAKLLRFLKKKPNNYKFDDEEFKQWFTKLYKVEPTDEQIEFFISRAKQNGEINSNLIKISWIK